MPERESSPDYPKWDYREYPKTLPRDDIWGQVRRTIMGRRITEEEVGQLVAHVQHLLDLHPEDALLEFGCGNGALSSRLFSDCSAYLGVDYSEYLIEIATERFERLPSYRFLHGDASQLGSLVETPALYNKCLGYAVIQYWPVSAVDDLLGAIARRFENVVRLVIGNVPDRRKAAHFYGEAAVGVDLDEHEAQIGRWWTPDELGDLAAARGWHAEFARLPAEFFNAGYRFDAILTRA